MEHTIPAETAEERDTLVAAVKGWVRHGIAIVDVGTFEDDHQLCLRLQLDNGDKIEWWWCGIERLLFGLLTGTVDVWAVMVDELTEQEYD